MLCSAAERPRKETDGILVLDGRWRSAPLNFALGLTDSDAGRST